MDGYNICDDFYKIEDIKARFKFDVNHKILYPINKVELDFDFEHSGVEAKEYFSDIAADSYIKANVLGLPSKIYQKNKNIDIHTWIEEIIHSISLYEVKDYKFAVQTAISVLDRYISDEFKFIYNYYCKIDLNGKSQDYIDVVNEKIKDYKSKIKKSYLYTKLDNIMKDYNFNNIEIINIQNELRDYNNDRNLAAHCMDGEVNKNGIAKRYSNDFENNYKDVLYRVFKSIYLIDYNGDDINDIIEYEVE